MDARLVSLVALIAACPLTNCLRTISEVGATGEVSTAASSATGTSGAGTGGGNSGSSTSGGASSGTGGLDLVCRGMPDGPPCHLTDGGLGNCYGETCQVIDFSSDPRNCGRYGLYCPPPAVCTDYACFEPGAGGITCMDGKTRCEPGQVCIPFEGCEWQSCGSSVEDRICTIDPMVCTLGGCLTTGFCCQNACLSPVSSDPLNCGDCGVACQDGAICVQGQCRVPDPSCGPDNNNHLCVTSSGGAGACCLSECADDMSDVLNCGRCGTICPLGASCQEGICGSDAGGPAGCGSGGPSVCPAGTSCNPDLFISPCFRSSCAPGSNGIECILDGGDFFGSCCEGVCGRWPADGGCSG